MLLLKRLRKTYRPDRRIRPTIIKHVKWKRIENGENSRDKRPLNRSGTIRSANRLTVVRR